MNNRNIEIPLERYEQLIDVESRVNVAVELACNNKYIEIKDLLLILGTEKALAMVNKIIEENEKRKSEYLESKRSVDYESIEQRN